MADLIDEYKSQRIKKVKLSPFKIDEIAFARNLANEYSYEPYMARQETNRPHLVRFNSDHITLPRDRDSNAVVYIPVQEELVRDMSVNRSPSGEVEIRIRIMSEGEYNGAIPVYERHLRNLREQLSMPFVRRSETVQETEVDGESRETERT